MYVLYDCDITIIYAGGGHINFTCYTEIQPCNFQCVRTNTVLRLGFMFFTTHGVVKTEYVKGWEMFV